MDWGLLCCGELAWAADQKTNSARILVSSGGPTTMLRRVVSRDCLYRTVPNQCYRGMDLGIEANWNVSQDGNSTCGQDLAG